MHVEYNATAESPTAGLTINIPQPNGAEPVVERDVEANDMKTDDEDPHPNVTVRNAKVSFFGIEEVADEESGGAKTPRSPRKFRRSLGSFSSSFNSFFSFRSESFDSGVISAALEGEENGFGQRNSSQRKIQFHPAKKLSRAVSTHYLKSMHDTQASRFENWTSAELIRLLVEIKHCPLRDEQNIDIVTLRDMVEAECAEDEEVRKPQPYSPFDIVLRNVMARRIQAHWINHLVYKRIEKEKKKSKVLERRLTNMRSSMDLMDLNEEDIYQLNTEKQIIVGGTTIDIESGHNNIPLELFDDMPPKLHDPVLMEQQRIESYDSCDQPTTELGLEGKSSVAPITQQQRRIRNILDIPWTPPDIEKAKTFANYLQPRKGGKGGQLYDLYDTYTGRHCCLGGCGEQFDLWNEGKVSEFSIYGSGVTNYFKFMKWGFWLFVVLTIVALPAMVINNLASDSIEGNRGLKSLARTTVGNLAYAFNNGTLQIDIPGCSSAGVYTVDCVFHGREISMLYSILDIVICAIIFIGFIWLRIFETEEEKELTKSSVIASMYTISVSGLPKDAKEEDIINHFTKLAGYHDSVVAVSIAYDNLEEFQECKARGNIIHSKVNLVHELRYNCAKIKEKYMKDIYGNNYSAGIELPPTPIGSHVLQSSSHPNTRTTLTENQLTNFADSVVQRNEKHQLMEIAINHALEKFYHKMKSFNEELREKDKKLEELAKQTALPIYAYVTFNKVSDREKIEKMYNKQTWYEYFFDYKKLKMGRHWLKIRSAPEPSVIIWENLMFSMYERLKRRCVTTFSTLLLVIVSVVMIFSSKYLQQRASNNGSKTMTSCPNNWSAYTVEQKQLYVKQYDNALHCYCDEYQTWEQSQDSLCSDYLEKNVESQVLIYFASFVILVVNVLMEKTLRFLSAFEKHHTSDSKEMSIFIRLFILKYINTAAVFLINNNNVILNKIYGLDAKGSPEFTANWYNTVGVTIILVQLGEVINGHSETFLKYLMYNYRKARAIKENPKKSAVDQNDFIVNEPGSSRPIHASPGSNTALTIIRNNNDGGGTVLGAPVANQPSGSGRTANTSPVDEKKKLNTTTNNIAYTQDLLNKLFIGPEFEFSHNYSQLVTTIFVCLTFSSGIPILYPIAAANFAIFYILEKYFFIHLYKIPPHFNSKVGKMATTLIPYALIIHIVMAIWVLSNNGLFRDHTHKTNLSADQSIYYYYGGNNDDFGDISPYNFKEKLAGKITGYSTLPLFITLIIIVAIIVLMYVTQSVTVGVEKMYESICGCLCCITKSNSATTGRHDNKNGIYDRSYHNAVRRNLIKGLATYNILQNPVYKEAFGITWKFAVNNKEIRDVKNLQLRAAETINDNEVDASIVEEMNQQAAVRNAPADDTPKRAANNFFSSWIPVDKQPQQSSPNKGGNKRVTVKSVSRNRSFYNSFYQQQDDHIILETPASDRNQPPPAKGNPLANTNGKKKANGKEQKENEFHPEQLQQNAHLKTPGGVLKPTPVTIIPPGGKLKTNQPATTTSSKPTHQAPPPAPSVNRALPTPPTTHSLPDQSRNSTASSRQHSTQPHQPQSILRNPSPSRTVHRNEHIPYAPGPIEDSQLHHRHPQQPSPHGPPRRDYPVELDAEGFQKHSFLLYNDPKHKHHH